MRSPRTLPGSGAVNTVVFADGRAVGHNTDWSGFDRNFARGLPGADIGDVVQLGAGEQGQPLPTRWPAAARADSPSWTPIRFARNNSENPCR